MDAARRAEVSKSAREGTLRWLSRAVEGRHLARALEHAAAGENVTPGSGPRRTRLA
jgi:hypothetical protein